MVATPLIETARAKVNLTLEVLGKRADGYHELRSIVAFADFGDELTYAPSEAFSLAVSGPMAGAIDGANLIEKAVASLAPLLSQGGAEAPSGRFDLVKRIPVAAGLGGGSADAAAAIRAMLRARPDIRPDERQVERAALAIGADVPVCLRQETAFMGGVGEQVRPLPQPAPFPALIVNPGVKLATRDVFAALSAPALASAADFRRDADLMRARLESEGWRAVLLAGRNDLEPPARRLSPVIDDVLAMIDAAPGCWLARLSGSGPTCFGLFETADAADAAARAIGARRPSWWMTATELGSR
ncbi:MAG: 4-(cytidine 5'-diphospho)-2-C-methyl-D-erythritol kinase [Hyphomicrobiales bacterium]|nr:4-(cytidine 5'-diphospho)-2-C-methyl-D-erythritol kinase [Hyphomicrobiales bacterium]